MSICPHCGNELKIPDRAYANARNYDRRVKVTTQCCQRLVAVDVVVSFTVNKLTPKQEQYVKHAEDDWGVRFKPQPETPPAARVDEIPRFIKGYKYKVK